MDITPYGKFDQNEWFIIIVILASYLAAWLLPPKLNKECTFLLFLWGFVVSTFWDFTIGGGLFDYYDVNDSPHYEFFDLLSYFMYSPFSYFFMYFYEAFEINAKKAIPYIIAWSFLAIGAEWLALTFKMLTYKNGYTMLISFLIYLCTQRATILLYQLIRDRTPAENPVRVQ
ncbi:hypothetical protein ACFQZT_13655 [Paenibacillus sp. GCM10027628]|uniref:hypothetical protein n=1 Tax=Paenibacillus sp. GCM10027628 TaxID=3273413 RepID=UPI003625E803